MALKRVTDAFAYVGSGHPFYPHLERFRRQCEADAALPAIFSHLSTLGEPDVRSTIRGRLAPDGWQFRGLSLSLQFAAARFQALTLIYSWKTNTLKYLVFPEDPYLTSLPRYGEKRVLRYIPRRRLTFRMERSDGTRVIGKCVRPAETIELVRRLAAISSAVDHAPADFAVPAPLWARADEGVFFQREMPGQVLTGLFDRTNFTGLLRALGAIHHNLHRLEVDGIPEFDRRVFLQDLQDGMDWIACFRPEMATMLAGLRTLLTRQAPQLRAERHVFCHGDFSCNQVLHDRGQWSVVDFDDCLRADPEMEVASVIAFLKYDVPFFRELFSGPDPDGTEMLEAAHNAYLEGYRGALDRERLLWYRLCFELDYIARLFRRDRFDEIRLARAVAIVRRLADRYQKGDFVQ